MELQKLTAAEAAEAVRNKEITARELTEAYLSRCSAINSTINSFIDIFEQTSLRQADLIDQKVKKKEELPPLAGVPVAVKDDLCFKDAPTSCGSAALKSFKPPYHAAAVKSLVDAGAVIVGKTNLSNLSMGSSTLSSFAGSTANPWNHNRFAGDGGAAAVATGQCLLALSSDTGGALRMGASYCGLFGLRPTTGLISRHGLHTFAPSFAQVGIIAKDAEDAYVALQLTQGFDPRDSATAVVKDGLPNCKAELCLEGLRVGLPTAVFSMLSDKTKATLMLAKESYEALGVEFVDISLPLFKEALLCYYVIASAEASSNLGRFDGIRFGTPSEGQDLDELYLKTRSATLGAEGKRRSVIGTHLLSKDSFDLYYRQAQKVWALVRRDFNEALKSCALIMLPAVGGPAGLLSEKKEFIDAYQDDLFCAPVSLSGLPALCLPAGEVDSLPVGMQLVGPPFSEGALTAFASQAAPKIKLPEQGAL